VLLFDKYRLKVLQLWRHDTRNEISPFVKETEARGWHRPIGDPDLCCIHLNRFTFGRDYKANSFFRKTN